MAFFIASRFWRQARSDFRLYREETNEEITTKPDGKRCREGKCQTLGQAQKIVTLTEIIMPFDAECLFSVGNGIINAGDEA